MLAPIISNNLKEIKALCIQYKVKELHVYGSAASGKFTDDSDVDLIVKFDSKVPVEEYADLYFDLAESFENLLKHRIDLMTDKPIENKFLKQSIDESKQIIYAA
jgi:hypothetical protein